MGVHKSRILAPAVLVFLVLACFPVYAAPVEAVDISNCLYPVAAAAELNNAKHTIRMAMYCLYVHKGNSSDPVYKLITALSEAVRRGVKVEVYLDSSQGNSQANQTAAAILEDAGAQVFFTRGRKLHAKLIVIDDEVVIEGSSNWTAKALSDNWEANTILKGKEIARLKSGFFEGLKMENARIEPCVAVPFAFLRKAGEMTKRGDRCAFDFYLYLLRRKADDYVPIDYLKTAEELGIRIDGVKGGYRRQIRQAVHALKARYGLIDYRLDNDFNLSARLTSAAEAAFSLPETYWDSGAAKQLSLRERFFCLIGYAQQEAARPNPYWSRGMEWLAKNYGVHRSTLSRAAMALRRKDILEIDFARAKGSDFKHKDASRYRMKGFFLEEERREFWQALEDEYGAALVTPARSLAAMIDEGENVTTTREFIELIRQYSYPRVLKATQKIARYNPQNPLRNVRFIAGVVAREP